MAFVRVISEPSVKVAASERREGSDPLKDASFCYVCEEYYATTDRNHTSCGENTVLAGAPVRWNYYIRAVGFPKRCLMLWKRLDKSDPTEVVKHHTRC